MANCDEEGKELIERLIGQAEIIEHAFKDGDHNKIIAQIHRIQVLMTKLSPHIHDEHARKVNEIIVADLDELVQAQLSNNASPKHVQEVVERAYKVFKAVL